jgi:Helix-turn-helix domain
MTIKTNKTQAIRSFDLNTKQGKLFNALVLQGQELTESEISKRFSIKNPRATISDIRARGFAIYANRYKAGNGVNVTAYRYGQASRKMVALAYKAMAQGLTV